MSPPIVMIHGAFSGGWAFERFREPFEARGMRVLAPTLRHHDLEPRQKPPAALGTTSVLDYVDDLLLLLDGLDEPPVVIGHSMGGLIAQLLAAKRPVRALALLAPSPPYGVLPSTSFEIQSAYGLYLAGNFWNVALKPRFWIAAAHALDRFPVPERHAVFERFVPESGQAMFEILHWPLDTRAATRVHARDLRCPVLCAVGSEDRVNSPRTVRRIASRYRGRFVELEGMSHWLVGEPGWEEAARLVESFIEEALAEPPAARAAE